MTELGIALAERLESGERGRDDGREEDKMSEAEGSGDDEEEGEDSW